MTPDAASGRNAFAIVSAALVFVACGGCEAEKKTVKDADKKTVKTVTQSKAASRALAEEPPKGLFPAEKGKWTILNKPLTAPFPRVAFDNLWQVWPEPLKTKAENAPEKRQEMARKRYGFQKIPGRDLPLQFTPAGKGMMAANCFYCHCGKVNGKVIEGLGNSHLNLGNITEDLASIPTLAE